MQRTILDRSQQNIFSNWFWKVDKLTLLIIIFMMIFGLICVSTASVAVANRINVNPIFFIKKQIIYSSLAGIILFITSMLTSSFFKKTAFYLYFITASMVVLTLFAGMEVKGSRRWLAVGNFSFQPSEFLKITLAILNAKILTYLTDTENFKEKFFIYIFSFGLCIISIALLVLQPDIGMSCLIFCTWIAQLFITGIPLFILIIPLIIFLICGCFAYFLFDHVNYRINNFIFSFNNSSEVYQIKQSIETFKSGGFFGLGPWQGKAKFHLPDSHTDFIFSVIGEEFGIITCIILLSLYIFLAIRVVQSSVKKQDLFNILVIVGLSTQFVTQALINIGVNIRLLPAKGMTLPFISYGGSSIFASALLFGIILTINKKEYSNIII